MNIRPFFRWYDLWIGAYVWWPARTVFICPLPMIGLRVEFSRPMNYAALASVIDEKARLEQLSNKALVSECLKVAETDIPIIEEMMNRLDSTWADE